ncbi:MAG: arylsulfotransferase family protein [Cytophagales bacterium]|nr:arylsulfotransferase family protein [Cytophagales bacterium]
MKSLIYYCCLLFALSSCNQPKNELLLAGSGFHKIVKVNPEGKILWEHPLEKHQECNAVASLGDGKVLYSFKQGAKAVDSQHNVLWQYDAPKGTELQSVELLPNGNYLLGQCGNPAKILEFSPENKLVKSISFDTQISRPHAQFRHVARTPKGTYVLGLFARKVILEVSDKGEILNTFPVNAVPFAVEPLANGNWMVSGGDRHNMLEIDPETGREIKQIADGELSVPFRFVAEIKELSSGNKLICNWGGHSKGKAKVAQVILINPENKVIQSINDWSNLGKISAIDLVKK